jgi:tetratricopeptide (TPR) repeat protein
MRNVFRFITRRSPILAGLAASFVVVLGLGAPAAQANEAIVHHRVSTTHADAQREFDAGLLLMYAFNPEEASYHFEQAANIDPQLAMAYWGIALAAGPNINTDYDVRRARVGREAIALARKFESHASLEERGYIEALAPRYNVSDASQIPAAQSAYAKAMGDLARRFPADLDAETLYAESLMDLTPLHMWNHDGTPVRYTRQVIALLDNVLRHDPQHVGADHLYIHAYEDSSTPQAAVSAARHLAALTLPPGAEHLAHMPAHIFDRVGDYEGSIQANLKAIAMFRQYVPQEHSDIHNAYYHHDYQVLDFAYMMSGQWAKAHDAAIQVANQVGDNAAGVETYLRFHKWQELQALPPPQAPDLRWRFAHAMAAAGTGDLGEARSTLQWIDSLHDRDPRTGVARSTLAAAIDRAERHDAAEIDDLRKAVVLQDGLPSREPPAWYYPVRETLGARLALAGRYAEAQRVFEDDLRRNPNNPRSLFGLSQVLAKTAPARAEAVKSAFERAWRNADVTLTLNDL